MILPKGIPMLEAKATKNWTRPDNVFCSPNTEELVVICDTGPHLRGPGADHIPILTTLELPLSRAAAPEMRNFRMIDWVAFHEALAAQLVDIPSPAPLDSGTASKRRWQGSQGPCRPPYKPWCHSPGPACTPSAGGAGVCWT